MNPLIQHKKSTPLFFVALVLACFGLSPGVQAVNPPPGRGYPNALGTLLPAHSTRQSVSSHSRSIRTASVWDSKQ
jgi:hypothetical protein